MARQTSALILIGVLWANSAMAQQPAASLRLPGQSSSSSSSSFASDVRPAGLTIPVPPIVDRQVVPEATPVDSMKPSPPIPEIKPADSAAKKDDATAGAAAATGVESESTPAEFLLDRPFKALFDSMHDPAKKSSKHWYEKVSLRGYTQFRFARTLNQDLTGAAPFLFGDRSINGNAENFSIRRARFILFGDVTEHLGIYFQPDFASTPQGATNSTFFGQFRDAYGDVYVDKDKVHRFRVGLSKVPFGFENMQSSQNRGPLDRTDAINTGVSPNERDLGVFYYWTPVGKQKLFRDLVDGGLKGSGNYGIVGFGVYNGQGGSQFEQNLNLHMVGRVTWPWELPSGQIFETSIQAYTGDIVVSGSPIRPLGVGAASTPRNTGGTRGLRDQRVAGTLVWYPQPFGLQAEWNVGEGPGLNDRQTAVEVRSLHGGYLMAMYRWDTLEAGIVTPFVRWQYFRGGYRAQANAPYGTHDEWNIGVEWQIRKEMELVVEYDIVNGPNLNAINQSRAVSYRNFDGHLLRVQFQLNY